MLYIILEDNKQLGWHTGEKAPLGVSRIPEVVEVQADGDELEYIRNKFSNLPIPLSHIRVVNWYGDLAKLIAGNLI